MTRTNVVLFGSVSERLENALRSVLDPERYDVVSLGNDTDVDSAKCQNADVFICSQTVVDAKLLDMAPNVKLIIDYQAGRNQIDRQVTRERNIKVVEIPCLALYSVAEFAVMSMLALPKRYYQACRDTRKQVWLPDLQPMQTTSTSYAYNWVNLVQWDAIYGNTVGLIGMGTVGRAVAKLLGGFGVHLLYADIQRMSAEDEEKLNARFVSREDLLKESDFVSVHVKLNEGTRGMLAMREFSMMKPTAFLINTSRGPVVNEDDLIGALRDGKLAGAALDVFDMEPLPTESPLWNLENVIITPHVAGIPVAAAAKTEAVAMARLITNSSG